MSVAISKSIKMYIYNTFSSSKDGMYRPLSPKKPYWPLSGSWYLCSFVFRVWRWWINRHCCLNWCMCWWYLFICTCLSIWKRRVLGMLEELSKCNVELRNGFGLVLKVANALHSCHYKKFPFLWWMLLKYWPAVAQFFGIILKLKFPRYFRPTITKLGKLKVQS